MSHIHWPSGTQFKRIVLAPEDRTCPHCGRFLRVVDNNHRKLRSLEGPLHVVTRVCRCPDPGCPGHQEKPAEDAACSLAPPCWTVDWDLFAWMGHRRYSRHWSIPQICAEISDRYGMVVSPDVVEDYTAKYEVMVAARESDVAELVSAYEAIPDLLLSIDGLQPEKGHECLYVVRELRAGRVWFAEALLSSASEEVKRLFDRARDLAERVGKPVRGWVSDKQKAFVTGIQDVFPGVPHRYCQNHFIRDTAKLVLEQDSHAKVQMRRKVRGLRQIEREIVTKPAPAPIDPPPPDPPPPDPPPPAAPGCGDGSTPCEAPVRPQSAGAAPPSGGEAPGRSESEQVVLDYCAAVRGILNDDQGGPLHPPGVRMAEALGEVKDSIGRARAAKKGGPPTES